MSRFHNADISVAVATDTGLITPIVFTANNKGLAQINSDMKDLKEKAFAGRKIIGGNRSMHAMRISKKIYFSKYRK